MQIIIPMSGMGTRFINAGYKMPKPLIQVDNKPIIEYIVRNFFLEEDFLFICNEEHLAKTNMLSELKRIKPTGIIKAIPVHKKGPVWTVKQAFEHIKDDQPAIVNYCDFNWVWNYENFKTQMLKGDYDGAIACYKGFHPHLLGPNKYASCKVDEKQNLTEIREKFSWTKDKMKSWQSSGTYYFKSGAILKHYYQQQINQNVNLNGEYYASLTYNEMVKDNLKIHIYPIEKFCQWGTPKDLEEFNYWLKYFRN